MANNADRPADVRNVATALNPIGAFDPEADPVCCGKRMEPRLAKARDRSGNASFVAVWRCAACGRVSR